MRNEIIGLSIESLRQEGLKFSVDTIADKLKISKKTIYKYFSDKETLALALYDKYYGDAVKQAEKLVGKHEVSAYKELLHLYFDSKWMTRGNIFNKYKLNGSIYAYVAERNDVLWAMISSAFSGRNSEEDRQALRYIIDGSFEKLCNAQASPDAVIERLVDLLW